MKYSIRMEQYSKYMYSSVNYICTASMLGIEFVC